MDGAIDEEGALAARVYEELRALAARHMRHERPGHTLQPTALANEAYLRMQAQQHVADYGRGQFLALAARMIRRVLVDHARTRHRQKRGGAQSPVTLHDGLEVSGRPDLDMLALHDALERLAALDPRQAEVVELRFFGGLTVEETAAVLGVSPRTVNDDWRAARAWLRRELA